MSAYPPATRLGEGAHINASRATALPLILPALDGFLRLLGGGADVRNLLLADVRRADWTTFQTSPNRLGNFLQVLAALSTFCHSAQDPGTATSTLFTRCDVRPASANVPLQSRALAGAVRLIHAPRDGRRALIRRIPAGTATEPIEANGHLVLPDVDP